jgi:Ca2+-binding RTX toxin-like protein
MIGAIVVGGTGDDSITSASDTTITIAGGSGSDTLGASGDVTATVVAGGSKAVQMSVTGGTSVSLYGGSGDDTVAAVGGQSINLFGEDGNNTYQLTGTANNPLSVYVNDLDTTGAPFAQTDSLPNGINTLQFPGVSGITIDLSNFSSGTALTAAQLQQVAPGLSVGLTGQFQNVVGTPGDDYIKGNSGPNILDAGGSGNDTLIGGSGPATLIAGSGNDSLVAGSGGTTYRFPSGTSGSVIVDPPVDTGGLNALDFSQFGSAVGINLGLGTAQSVGGGLSVTLQNPTAINGYVASAFNDSVTGNTADDRFFVGAGNDTFVGGGGNDTYFFNGGHLGADTLTETPTTSNALNFLAFDGPINLDLTQSSQQTLNPGNLALTLTNPSAFSTAVGTPYNDTIKANSGNDTLIGAGGQDSLVAGNGNVNLQGDLTQVVYLQFLTSTLPDIHNYTAAEQSAILSNLQQTYSALNYFFTLDLPAAQQHAQATGGRYKTLTFNQGPAGGAANELNPGNIDLGGSATINVNPFMGDPAQGLVSPSSANLVNISTTIAAHELGHLSGLQHQDGFGPIGTGIYSNVKPSEFNPAFPGPQNATETPLDIMASPDSVGTTLANAASQTQIGERDAIKLAFNDTGSLLKQSSLPTEPVNVIPGVSSAYVVNNLPGLTVPNTLLSGTRDFGQTFNVNAVAINGTLATTTQQDFYAINAPASQLTIQVISRNNTLNPRPIIPELEVLDANGNQVAYNEKEFESLDSTLLDLSLTAGGTYYVGVDSFLSLTTGNYQLFMYSFATGAVQNSGDTMVGGGGNDTIQGSSGNDFVTFQPGSAGSATVNAGSGHDTVDTSPAPAEKVTTTGNVTIIQPATSATATSLQSNANPSVYGQQVTFTATVTTSGSGTPTGTVTFSDGNTVLGTQSLNQVAGNDQAMFSTTTLSVATHSITATYNGDPNFTTSTSSAVSQVVNAANTTTSLSSSANPSAYGQSVTFTATVAPVSPGAGTPTGTVLFYDGNTQIGSGSLNQVSGNDQATFSTSSLSVATHSITASYQTDGNFATSTSSAVSQTVNQDATTTSLSSSVNPSAYGQSVTFTATVGANSPGSGTPTGSVNFYDGSTLLGSGTLAVVGGKDQATYSTATLSAATHSITATYAGDTNFITSTSSAVSQVVNQANTTTAGSVSGSGYFGTAETFTATVTANSPSTATVVGTVDFFDTTTNNDLGTVALSGGKASLTTTMLPTGTQTITMTYNGNANFVTSNTSVSVTIVTSIFVMNASADKSLNATGNSVINIPGLVFVDSTSSSALNAGDAASITGGAIQVVGGVMKAKGATLNPPPTTGVAAVADPWANLAAPTGGSKMGSVKIGDHTNKTIDPGIYSSISVSGSATLTLNPGIYAIAGGGLNISGNGTVKGNGVLIYNAGSNYPKSGGSFGSISIINNAVLNISAASTGTYAGVAVFQARDNTLALTVGGTSVVNLQGGLLYAVKAQLAISSGGAVRRAPIIVDTLGINGTAVIKNTDTGSPMTAIVPDMIGNQQVAFSLAANSQPTASSQAASPVQGIRAATSATNGSKDTADSSIGVAPLVSGPDRSPADDCLADELWTLDAKPGSDVDGRQPTRREARGR